MNELSDGEFAGRALAWLPDPAPSTGFEGALLAGYDGWRNSRRAGLWAALKDAARGFGDVIWPGAPLWAPAGALAVALLLGIGLGAMLPALGGERMGFSLDQTPGFTLLTTDSQEDL